QEIWEDKAGAGERVMLYVRTLYLQYVSQYAHPRLAYICSGLVNIMRGRSFCYTKWHESQVQCGKEDTYREKCFGSREASPHVTLSWKPTDVTVFDILFQTHFILIENTMQKDEMVDVEEAKTS
ncbi:unnamed protein product, partial [Brassica rapa subsp. narinosa]